MKLAIIQNNVYEDKRRTLDEVSRMAVEANAAGAEMLILPEMFCTPYETDKFIPYAEEKGGMIWQRLSNIAKENRMVVVGGSFAEREFDETTQKDKFYNTCFVFDSDGRQMARHRKVHLFDIDIKGGQYFKESDTFAPGEGPTVFKTLGHTFGVAICFDIRFAGQFREMALAGAELVCVPAAFNMTTGPLHWELAFRSRAVDNQYFTVGAAPARNENGKYVSFANSIVCDPWGRVLANAGTTAGVTVCDIDFEEVKRVREQLPIIKNIRKSQNKSAEKT